MANLSKPTWTAIPAARSSAAILNLKLYLILFFLAILTIFSLVGSLGWIAFHNAKAPAVLPTAPQVTSITALGQQAANEYLAGTPFSIPSAVANPNTAPWPNGSHAYFEGSSSSSVIKPIITEYYLVNYNTTLYTLALTFATKGQAAYLATDPSLLPFLTTTSSKLSPLSYGKILNATQTIPLADAQGINRWTRAFFGGTSKDLATEVGSPGTYAPLTGFSAKGAPLILSAVINTDKSIQALISVQAISTQNPNLQTTLYYSVLVSAEGNVVAWAPDSLAPLTPYQNKL
jgi:hypothetical protein